MANATTTARIRSTTGTRARGGTGGVTRCRRCGSPAPGGCSCNDGKVPCGCGELKCLCRPNWVAGMVLREQDLKRLDTYIIERFRRINLDFFGPGVVNGLEVRCDPCGPGVVVGCGHAISPCGDDIVICDDAYVDICELVRKCRKQERADCLPHERPRACPEVEEQWVLAVEYVERPADGALPLRREAESCGCGGGGDCGCGGQGSHDCSCATAQPPAKRPRGAPAGCEPRLLCEDFRFKLCPPPELPPACRFSRDDNGRADEGEDNGPLMERLMCCLEDLVADLPEIPPSKSDAEILHAADAWYTWLCQIKRHLLNFAARHPVASCDAIADLDRLQCLRPSDFSTSAAYLAWLRETFARLAVIVIEMMLSCLCSALLPPCPEPATSTAIPIATVTVSYAGGGCRVVGVCNWTRLRKYSANLRNLEYWLSAFPLGREFRRLLECLCCDLLSGLFDDRDKVPGVTVGVPVDGSGWRGSAMNAATDGNDEGDNAATPEILPGMAHIRERLNRRLRPMAVGADFDRLAGALDMVLGGTGKPVEPETLMRDLFTRKGKGDTLGGSARNAPAETLLMSSLVAPLLRGVRESPVFAEKADEALRKEVRGGSEGEGDEIAALREELAALRERVDGLDKRKKQ